MFILQCEESSRWCGFIVPFTGDKVEPVEKIVMTNAGQVYRLVFGGIWRQMSYSHKLEQNAYRYRVFQMFVTTFNYSKFSIVRSRAFRFFQSCWGYWFDLFERSITLSEYVTGFHGNPDHKEVFFFNFCLWLFSSINVK